MRREFSCRSATDFSHEQDSVADLQLIFSHEQDFLKKHKIDYVAHDEAPYPTPNSVDCYEFIKKMGMFIPTKRATNISTTKIITEIIKNYDLYIRRQILRGISYKELNISFLKKERIRLHKLVLEDVENMKEEFKIAFEFWEKFTKKWYSKIFSRNQSVFSKVISIVEDMRRPSKAVTS